MSEVQKLMAFWLDKEDIMLYFQRLTHFPNPSL